MAHETKATQQFTNTLDQIRYGALSDELTERMTELTRICRDTGRVGEITLKLKITPHASGQMEIADNVVVKLPVYPRATTLMFSTAEGGLQRDDPRQAQLDFSKIKNVDVSNTTPPKVVV